jgi:AAHS family 4-hydroxybenzoate transporter-like MFS transporter
MAVPLFPQRVVDVPALIDSVPVSAFQRWLMVLVGCVVVVDGFDVQAMGFVAPSIIKAWSVNKAALGPVFGAGLFGMLLGSLALSVLADRIGRRPVLIGATLFFSLCMLATAWARSLEQLLLIRFVTGIGLGGIMANAMALVGEYSPARRRVSLMMWVSCGFTAGAVLGGIMSALLIPWAGWQAVFIFGGVVPLVMTGLMCLYLPESLQFLVLRQRRLHQVRHWLGKIAPHVVMEDGVVFSVPEQKSRGAPVAELFREGRGGRTLLLWAINFANLLNLFFLANWLPTLATMAGRQQSVAVWLGTTLQMGGVVGTLLMGPLIDRFGFYRVLIPGFLVGALGIGLMGQALLPMTLLYAVVAVGGFCIVGGQPAVNALAATTYPTDLRATGIGWSLGIGRAGSIVGPVLAGYLIGQQWSTEELFLAAAVPAVCSGALLLWMGRMRPAASSPVAQPTIETMGIST